MPCMQETMERLLLCKTGMIEMLYHKSFLHIECKSELNLLSLVFLLSFLN